MITPDEYVSLPDWLSEYCATVMRSASNRLLAGRKVGLTYYAITHDGKLTQPMEFPEEKHNLELAHQALKFTVDLLKPRAIIRIAEAWMLVMRKDGKNDHMTVRDLHANPERMDVLHISIECKKGGYYVGWAQLKRNDNGDVTEIEPVKYVHSDQMDAKCGHFFDHSEDQAPASEEPEEYDGGPIGFSA